MFDGFSRREFVELLGLGALMSMGSGLSAMTAKDFRIRTITAGVAMKNSSDLGAVEEAVKFLRQSQQRYEVLGYEVQTVRVATQPFAEYSPDWSSDQSLAAITKLDQLAVAENLNFSIGPIQTGKGSPAAFATWAAELIKRTRNISFSLPVAFEAEGVQPHALRSAAAAIQAIAKVFADGEGNFRFAATAFCPAGTPFFPAAYHQGEPAFSLGLESPRLLTAVFSGATDLAEAKERLRERVESQFAPVEREALTIAKQSRRHYWGIDLSPAPGPDASIGEAIELLSGAPFGSASTLSACAAITDVLKSLEIKKCGYSGLMLPVLEDKILAQRATEQRYSVSELLLYSSVCGTGLDVVPLPGDTSLDQLAAAIGDMAALATKYRKPLSARLLPLPGRKAGEKVQFDNPYLVDSAVMKID